MTGSAGGIDASAAVDIDGSGSLSVESPGSIGLGTLSTSGSIFMEAGGEMWDVTAEPPVNVMGDLDVRVGAGEHVGWKSIDGAPETMTLRAGGDIHFGSNSTTPGLGYATGQDCSQAGSSGTTVYSYRADQPEATTLSCDRSVPEAGGGLGVALLMFAGAAWLRTGRASSSTKHLQIS